MTTTALITGANKGLGFETARVLTGRGWTVLLGARDPALGAAAAARLGASAHVVALDVTSTDSVESAAALVADRFGLVDVLINNAGIGGPWSPPEEMTADEVRSVYDTNVFGPIRVTRTFLPLLRKSSAPRIVNVSSGMGSFGITTDPERLESTLVSIGYPTSKTALNAVTVQYAKALPDMRVNAVDPGYTATDINGHSGTQTVAEGVESIVAMATVGPDGPTGGYYDRHGPIPW